MYWMSGIPALKPNWSPAGISGDMRTRDLVLYCAGAGSRGLYIRHNIAESKADEVE